ncbi:MAG: hypothetical protein MK132_04035 [Lentisphaerales bacterium]|nr:hypothetical protein [Lentisphaerales bacterium]
MYIQKLIAFVAIFMFVFSSFAAELAEKDADNDGKLSVEEFAADDKKLKKAFKKLDTDSDGFLNDEEFKKSQIKKGDKKDKKKKKKGNE